MSMTNQVLFSFVGMTDPMKSYHDGPLLHIVRHYRPQKVYAYLSKEIGDIEREYNLYTRAIHLVSPECIVEPLFYDVEDVSDFDVFSAHVNDAYERIHVENPDAEILVNISSGTPQMISAACLLIVSLNMKFKPIQVKTPVKAANRDTHLHFDCKTDDLDAYYRDENLDAANETENRCYEPAILSYKEAMVKTQIKSLIKDYDYEAVYVYLKDNNNLFETEKFEKIFNLVDHAKRRLNLEAKAAEQIAKKLGLMKELYPIEDTKAKQIIEYYLSMNIRRIKNDLSGFVLKLTPFTDALASYLLVDALNISMSKIAIKKGEIYVMDSKRAEENLPGITAFMDEMFIELGRGRFQWEKPVNYASLICVIEFVQKHKKAFNHPDVLPELREWTKVSIIRNSVAHTLSEITLDSFNEVYGKSPKKLCARIEFVLRDSFKTKFKEEIFTIYDSINKRIEDIMNSK